MAVAPQTGAKRLRELLKDPNKIVMAPGVFDGFTARLALATGFDALYMTGAGTSISRMGWADLGIAQLNDMVANASMIASLNPSVPVIADADTGYGGPVMVSRTVIQYSQAGIAGLHIEDQVQQKRCGHLLGKQLVDRDTYYARLRAAVDTRNKIGSDMLIIARTDARQSYGFDEAIERLEEAVRIGVDVVFFEAMNSKEEAARVCQVFKATNTPCFLNMVPGGVTPNMTAQEAKELGFKIVIFPGVCMEPLLKAVGTELETLKQTGAVSTDMAAAGVKHAFNLAGLQECIDLDLAAGGSAYNAVGK